MEWSMRTMSSRTLVGCGIEAMNWVPLLKFGFGNVPAFNSRTAFWSIKFAGITFPGNGFPAVRPSAAYIASLAGSETTGTTGAAFPDGVVYARDAPVVGKFGARMALVTEGELPWIS